MRYHFICTLSCLKAAWPLLGGTKATQTLVYLIYPSSHRWVNGSVEEKVGKLFSSFSILLQCKGIWLADFVYCWCFQMDSIFSTSMDISNFSSYYRARYTTIKDPLSQGWTTTQTILFLAITTVFTFQMKILVGWLKWRVKPSELHHLFCKHSCDSNTETVLESHE